jgi:hypothetical protein
MLMFWFFLGVLDIFALAYTDEVEDDEDGYTCQQ